MPEETSATDVQYLHVQTSGNCVTKLQKEPFEGSTQCTSEFAELVQRRIKSGPVAILWSVRADGVIDFYRK